MSDDAPVAAEESQGSRINVERAGEFSRIVADVALAMRLQRDLEIVCLQSAPTVMAQVEAPDGHSGFELAPSILEVARVRLGYGAAIAMALQILEELSDAKSIKAENIVVTLRQIVAKLEERIGTRQPESIESTDVSN